MAGYTRQSVADIVDGEDIIAAPLNNEFNAIQAAMHATTGHAHDASAGNGPKIVLTTSVSGVLPVANGGYAAIHKINGTTAPTANDDSGDGYGPGSWWIDTTNDIAYVCVDATLTAAVWVRSQVYDAELAAIAALAVTDSNVIVGNGTTWVAESGATARTSLGLTIGTDVQAYDTGLAALASFNTNGILVQTADNTFAGRTLTAPAAGFTITNGDGVSGNPTFVLSDDLAALEGLSNGIPTRTAHNTWTNRTITGTTAEITVTNGDGVSGNPTLSLPTALTFTGKTITGGTFASVTLNGTPTISGTPTAAGATWANLGTVTTADINGGTIDGTTIGGSSRADGSFSKVMVDGTSFYMDVESSNPILAFDTNATSLVYTTASGQFDLVIGAQSVLTATTSAFNTNAIPFAAPSVVSTSGIVATQAQQEAATTNVAFVTPGRQHFHPSAAKAWVRFDASSGTPTIGSSYNVTSLTDGGVGNTTVVIATDLSSANNTVPVASAGNSGSNQFAHLVATGSATAAGFVVFTCSDAGTATDCSVVCAHVMGDI